MRKLARSAFALSTLLAGPAMAGNFAYPVMTMHEERDILEETHIVLKTRQVEVRGSNGHFYDVVHGISVRDGVRVQDVSFDVTTEVTGRSSGLVAANAVASALP
jgi:hypothetical protein